MSDARVPIDLRRRDDARLQVSRIAAELIWRDGLAATRGDDIAAEAGIATRTLWRYFRSKEACVEPVLVESGRRFLAVLAAWPRDLSIEEFFVSSDPHGPVVYGPDDIHAMRMIHLGRTEPALRSAWLTVCDDAERIAAELFAPRLGLPAGSAEVRRIAAAVSGAVRALNDDLSTAYVETGTAPSSTDVLANLTSAIVESSNGRLGPAVA